MSLRTSHSFDVKAKIQTSYFSLEAQWTSVTKIVKTPCVSVENCIICFIRKLQYYEVKCAIFFLNMSHVLADHGVTRHYFLVKLHKLWI